MLIDKKEKYFGLLIILLLSALIILFLLSFLVGRYGISPKTVIDIILSRFIKTITPYWEETMVTVVLDVRMPRIILAILVGGTLSLAGASYQTLFKNPMVSPDILGVSAGAGFGAALAMLYGLSQANIQLLAFIFGLSAVLLSFLINLFFGNRSITVLILAGMVVSSFFQALLSIVKLYADTDSTLPSITFWLMGNLGKGKNADILAILPVIIFSIALLFFFRNQIDALSSGEDEARTLGVNVPLVKSVVVLASTLMTVVSVSICGIIGWVGLIVPHIARMITGASYRRLAPISFLIGGIFLILVDDVIRAVPGAELPLGVLTALVGTPVFVLLLSRVRKGWS